MFCRTKILLYICYKKFKKNNKMETTDLVKNNKRIAEFLGKKYKDNCVVIGNWNVCSNNPSGEVWEQCRYHSDWNWLMEVVDNIKNATIKCTFNGVIITMGKNLNNKKYCCIEWGSESTGGYSKTFESEILIEAVYNSCVDFIKWHDKI